MNVGNASYEASEPKLSKFDKCTIADCPVCRELGARSAGAPHNKYLPTKIPVAPGQISLGLEPCAPRAERYPWQAIGEESEV